MTPAAKTTCATSQRGLRSRAITSIPVDRGVLAGDGGRGEVRERVHTAGSAEGASLVRQVEQAVESGGQRPLVARRNEVAGASVHHAVGEAAGREGDDRSAREQR